MEGPSAQVHKSPRPKFNLTIGPVKLWNRTTTFKQSCLFNVFMKKYEEKKLTSGKPHLVANEVIQWSYELI